MSESARAFLFEHGTDAGPLDRSHTESVERGAVASGYAKGTTAPSDVDLAGAFVIERTSSWLAAFGAAEDAVRRAPLKPGVYGVDAEGLALEATSEGVRSLDDGRLLIDARAASQHVLLASSVGRVVLEFAADAVHGFVLRPLPEVIAMQTLLGPVAAPQWMRDKYALGADGSLYARVAAVAAVARLWPAASAYEALGTAVFDAIARDDTPAGRAGQWLASLAEADRDALVSLFGRECDALEGALDAIDDAPAAVRWLERRDDLESVAVLLRDDLRAAARARLESLDTRARASVSWAELAAEPSEQLLASESEDPGTWWTDLS